MAVIDGLTFFQLLHQLMAGSRQTPPLSFEGKDQEATHQEQETFIKVGKGHRMPPAFPQ